MKTENNTGDFARLESLIREIDEFGDPATNSRLQEIIQALLDYHGAAVARLIETVRQAKGPDVVQKLTDDDLVSSLLLLYDLHPVDLQTRVESALDKVRPYLRSHGGEVELLSIDNGVVRLRMQGSCHGCPSSAVTMQTTIEQAIYAAAPDVVRLEVEGLVDTASSAPQGFVSLSALAKSNGLPATACASAD
ncbi:MAG TPA: NifU family protein [Pirellulales bacterium]|jgi:Fe-S cluster biogenesis protein NfuA|nr:NifU family protein [Pirellulales bacterium]